MRCVLAHTAGEPRGDLYRTVRPLDGRAVELGTVKMMPELEVLTTEAEGLRDVRFEDGPPSEDTSKNSETEHRRDRTASPA